MTERLSAMTASLTAHTVARTALAASDFEAMLALFRSFYDGVSEASFRRDLSNKDWVILLREPAGRIQGFSTLALYASQACAQPVSVVYSGDTIIHPDHWGSPELPRAWIRTVLEKSAGLPRPLYWLLISSGYKTYRFLPVFYKTFYPRYDQPTPPDIQAIQDAVARERFGDDYCAERGIVRFKSGATPLRADIARLTPERLTDPHIAFFAERNPGHAQGDELVCLTEIALDNLTAAGRRMLR